MSKPDRIIPVRTVHPGGREGLFNIFFLVNPVNLINPINLTQNQPLFLNIHNMNKGTKNIIPTAL